MADYREVGIGVASALRSVHGANPFPMAFRGQSLPEAARIVTAILDECAAAEIRLEKVELDAELFDALPERIKSDERIVSNTTLPGQMLIFRPAD